MKIIRLIALTCLTPLTIFYCGLHGLGYSFFGHKQPPLGYSLYVNEAGHYAYYSSEDGFVDGRYGPPGDGGCTLFTPFRNRQAAINAAWSRYSMNIGIDKRNHPKWQRVEVKAEKP